MPKTLDRSRKFATTYGEARERFYQDGTYFDAAGNEVVQAPQAHRETPPLAAGRPAGKPEPGAKAAEVRADATPAPAVSDETLRAQLAPLNFGQIKKLFVKAGGPADFKGAGAQARMVEWLVTNRSLTVAADAQPEAPPGA